jgi:hypothetical protein
VHSVFARAVNLVDERGRLTALLAADAPRVAHGLRLQERCGDFARWFSPEAAFRWDGEDLCIVSRFAASVRIATGGSEVWHGRVQRNARAARDIARAAGALVSCTPHPHPSPARGEGSAPSPSTGEGRGEGGSISTPHPRPSPARGEGLKSPSPSTGEGRGEGDSRAQRAFELRLLALRDAYRAGDAGGIAHAVHGLVGLGAGLTPAGDDALIGWLAGIALLGTDGRSDVLRQALHSRLARTTDVSRAHLEDALAGEFSEPLARFADALTRSPADAQRALAELAAVGATSGLDAAAGLLAAVQAAAAAEPCHA